MNHLFSFLHVLLLCVNSSQSWLSPSFSVTRPTRGTFLSLDTKSLTRLWANSRDSELGFNELHTLLRDAVSKEDYMEAGRLSDIVLERLHGDNLSDDERRLRRQRLSWKGLGAAPWLTERLDALNYTFPTTIQVNALEAVNAILGDDNMDSSMQERIDKSVNDNKSMGVVVSGTTGSGKTLSYLVPLLSTLSDSLFVRQRLRVGAEEQVAMSDGSGDSDLLDRLAIVTSPQLRTNSRRPMQKGAKTIATGAALASLGKSGKDVKSPLALIVVPSRELGVQTAMLLYQLIGGNIKDSPDQLAGRANMFKYKGPKGIRIGCVLDDEEASFGLKLQTDVAITMPQYLGKLMEDGDVESTKLRVVVYDEADLALEETPLQDLQRLFQDDEDEREYTRLTFLVGASVTPSLGNLAVSSRILPSGYSYIATATRFAPLDSSGDTSTAMFENSAESPMNSKASYTASLQDLNICLYPGLKHERAIVRSDKEVLLALTRLLRKELQDYDKKVLQSPGENTIQRPRVVVFFPDEPRAKAAIEPLRDALWGEHRLCVLLPKTGVSPLTIMDQFKRNETTVMLATPNSVRGLDFPALTHVYTLYLPMEDPREYVHLAGRVGRIGQVGSVLGDGGHVISILPQDKAGKMQELADALGFEFTDLDTSFSLIPKGDDGSGDTEGTDVESMRRYLEDQITLLELTEDPEYSNRPIDVSSVTMDDDDDDEDDEDEDQSAFQ